MLPSGVAAARGDERQNENATNRPHRVSPFDCSARKQLKMDHAGPPEDVPTVRMFLGDLGPTKEAVELV